MSMIIVGALALSLLQFWLIPASTKLNDMDWLMGTRDEARTATILQGRIERAATNLKESLPAFLALSLLAMYQGTDVAVVASIWLLFRVIYVPCYMKGINPLRTYVWLGSIVCLIYMAIKVF